MYIPHPLGEIPGKVDVQVKVVEAGQEYIFPGIGSGQSDDDILAEYGGVAYLYNNVHVKVFIPIEKDDSAGIGRIVTTGNYVDSIVQTYLSLCIHQSMFINLSININTVYKFMFINEKNYS